MIENEIQDVHRKLWESISELETAIHCLLESLEAYMKAIMKKDDEKKSKPLSRHSIYYIDTTLDQIIQLQKFLLRKTFLCFQFSTFSQDQERIKTELKFMKEKERLLRVCKKRMVDLSFTWEVEDNNHFLVEDKLNEILKYYQVKKEILKPRKVKYEEPAPPWIKV